MSDCGVLAEYTPWRRIKISCLRVDICFYKKNIPRHERNGELTPENLRFGI